MNLPNNFPTPSPTGAVHENSKNFYNWLANLSLMLPAGYKAAIFFKETCFFSEPPLEAVYDIDQENNPHFVGYLFPNEKMERETHIYVQYGQVFEFDDNKNQNRSQHVFSDYCFNKLRRFTDSSIVDYPEAKAQIVHVFNHKKETQDMWLKVESIRPKVFYSNS